MAHLTLELIIWLALFFLVGCVIGYLLRRAFGASQDTAVSSETAVSTKPSQSEVKAAEPTVAEVPNNNEVKEESGTADVLSSGAARRPKGLAGPRSGSNADNLQQISGIGPKLERTLHSLGFYHFDQIAAWNSGEVKWVDQHLRFNGRIERDQWIEQAMLLASGDEAEFNRRFKTRKSARN